VHAHAVVGSSTHSTSSTSSTSSSAAGAVAAAPDSCDSSGAAPSSSKVLLQPVTYRRAYALPPQPNWQAGVVALQVRCCECSGWLAMGAAGAWQQL
jgi:hypothetical protein